MSTYNGSSWSAWKTIDAAGRGFGAVACPTTTQCEFTDHLENVVVWHTGAVTILKADPIGGDLTSISCRTSAACVAVDFAGYQVTINHTGTTYVAAKPTLIDANASLEHVSCPTSFFCVAVDSSGNFVQFVNTAWKAPVLVDRLGTLVDVSCTVDARCQALSSTNQTFAVTLN